MSAYQVARLALKLVGIYAVVLLIGGVPSVVWLFRSDSGISPVRHLDSGPIAAMILPLVLLALLAVAMFGLNRTLAWHLAGPAEGDVESAPDEPSPLQAVAFSVAGVYLAATSLPELVSTMMTVVFAESYARGGMWSGVWPTAVAKLLTFTLGAALFLGGATMADFWKRLQALTRPMGER